MQKTVENQVPAGYKKTELGIIPDDWEIFPLRDLLDEKPKYGINAAAVPLSRGLPVYIRITDISMDGNFSPKVKVGVNSPLSHLYQLSEGDLVLARTGASVGKSYLYQKEDGVLVYAGFLIKISPDQSKLNSKFLFHFLQTSQYWNWVAVNSMRSGQPGVNGNEYGRFPVVYPSLAEQTAIANALSDLNALIAEQEKLIAKKQAIKTATMQQLLTGKTRLPQFAYHPDGRAKDYKASELGQVPEDWEIRCLFELGSFQAGSGFPIKYQGEKSGALPFFKVSDMSSCGNDTFLRIPNNYISEEVAKKISAKPIAAGSVVFAKIGAAIYLERKRICSQHSCIDNNLMAHMGDKSLVTSKYLHLIYLNISLGGLAEATALPALSAKHVGNHKVTLPSMEEQSAIATILTDMDNEIEALQQRLAKTRQIKQGMMQELLTGKTRLPFIDHEIAGESNQPG